MGTKQPWNWRLTVLKTKKRKQWHGTPLQHSCLENPVDGGAWWAAVHGLTKSWTQLSDFTLTFHFHALEKEMATYSSILPGESQGQGSLVGCHLWGCTELDTTKQLSSRSSSKTKKGVTDQATRWPILRWCQSSLLFLHLAPSLCL